MSSCFARKSSGEYILDPAAELSDLLRRAPCSSFSGDDGGDGVEREGEGEECASVVKLVVEEDASCCCDVVAEVDGVGSDSGSVDSVEAMDSLEGESVIGKEIERRMGPELKPEAKLEEGTAESEVALVTATLLDRGERKEEARSEEGEEEGEEEVGTGRCRVG